MTATTFLPILFPADLAAGVVEGVTAAADVAAAAEAAAGAESVTGTNARAGFKVERVEHPWLYSAYPPRQSLLSHLEMSSDSRLTVEVGSTPWSPPGGGLTETQLRQSPNAFELAAEQRQVACAICASGVVATAPPAKHPCDRLLVSGKPCLHEERETNGGPVEDGGKDGALGLAGSSKGRGG